MEQLVSKAISQQQKMENGLTFNLVECFILISLRAYFQGQISHTSGHMMTRNEIQLQNGELNWILMTKNDHIILISTFKRTIIPKQFEQGFQLVKKTKTKTKPNLMPPFDLKI